jgi:hypothetical protein
MPVIYRSFSDKLTGMLALPKSLLSNDTGYCITEEQDAD